MEHSLYQIPLTTLAGESTNLGKYQGKVLLIVNTASKCGFTPQYQDLEAIYQEYKDRGLVVLGFPCNQFGKQEPGSDSDIQNFCQQNYGVSFPMFSKIDVNGNNAHPLYELLKQKAPGIMGSKAIKWNFTKFVVDKSGQVLKRFAPKDKPHDVINEIKNLL